MDFFRSASIIHCDSTRDWPWDLRLGELFKSENATLLRYVSYCLVGGIYVHTGTTRFFRFLWRQASVVFHGVSWQAWSYERYLMKTNENFLSIIA